jgi:HlyD family secretion protein
MTRKRAVLIGATVLVAGVALVAFSRNNKTPASFNTAAVSRGDVAATVGATGTVEAVATVQVGTQVTGTIWRLYVDFNSRVQKGQVVARLEPSLFESRLTEAKANLASGAANLERAQVAVEDTRRKAERARELASQDLLPRSELDVAVLAHETAQAQLKAAQASLQQAQASVAQAEVNLGHTVIYSPIDGVVISRNVDVGQTVAASLQAPTLFTIAEDLRQMRVVANVDEADVGTIAVGQKASFRVDAFPEENFTGTVSQVRLAPITVQNVVTYNALVDVENRDLKLRPGMTANVTFEVAQRKDVLLVPNAALRYQPDPTLLAERDPENAGEPARRWPRERASGGPPDRGAGPGHPLAASGSPAGPRRGRLVYLPLPGGKLRPVPVRPGLTDGRFTEIESRALKEGDLVVTGTADAGAAAGQDFSPMRFFGFGSRRR